MTAVAFSEFNLWLNSVGFDLKESLTTTFAKMADPALSAAEKWGAAADAYYEQYQKMSASAAYRAAQAATTGNTEAAQLWNTYADHFNATAAERLALGNEAWVRKIASEATSTLGKFAGPIAVGVNIVELMETVIVDGDADKFAEVSAGIVTGSVLGSIFFVGLTAVGAPWIGAAVLAGIIAGYGTTIGQNLWHEFGPKMPQWVSDLFTSSQTWVLRRDPLTLDLDADGLETVALNTTNPIYFDHDGDGNAAATGWISPDDGFLALDRNGNGTINSGRELFGDATPLSGGGTAADGFAALAQEDTNGDGVVNNSDTNFANLRLWQDLNQNGLSESNELFTLTQKGIASINVTQTENNTLLPNGNVIADLGTYTKTDGSTGTLGDTAQLGDIDLREDTFLSQFTDTIPLTPEAQALPGMQGSGQVREWKEAA